MAVLPGKIVHKCLCGSVGNKKVKKMKCLKCRIENLGKAIGIHRERGADERVKKYEEEMASLSL
jgi:hypothetical protein